MSEWNGDSSVFRGYFFGNGKKPTEKVKNQSGHSWDDVCSSESFGAILNDDFVDISFDTVEMFNAFLDMAEKNAWRCLALPSTHGGHTYWRNATKNIKKSGKDKWTAVGLMVDIHKGDTYIPLCVDGVKRYPPVYELLDGETYQEVPEELYPIGSESHLWGLKEHRGRNEEVFKHILKIQSDVTKDIDVARRILRNANAFVLGDSMSDDEMDTILRDESFNKPTFWKGDGSFDFAGAGDYLIQTYHGGTIDGTLHIYIDGIYTPDITLIERKMLEIIGALRKTQRKETLDYMRIQSDPLPPVSKRHIAFKNGILDIDSMELVDYDPSIVTVNKIPWNYKKDAYSTVIDNVLNKISCYDPKIRYLLEECAGYCLLPVNTYQKAFIFTGEKANGKSTYIDCIRYMLGDRNVSSLDLGSMGDRFNVVMLQNRLANLGDDISDEFMSGQAVATFKKITTGEVIKGERKGFDPFDFRPYCKPIFSANDIPRMRDRSGAVMRRLVIIPFNAHFSKNDADYDPTIRDKVKEQIHQEYMCRIAVEGLKRVIEQQGFTESEIVQRELDNYHMENDSVYGFCNEVDISEVENESTTDVFLQYTMWCSDNGLNAVAKPAFSKQLCRNLGLVTVVRRVGGKSVRMYVTEE